MVLAATTLGSAAAPAAAPASAGDAAARLVYLLEYVGSDYENAVRDGQVVDMAEYGEVLRFTKELIRAYGARADRAPAVTAGLADLHKLLLARAPADQVFTVTRKLLPALERSVGGAARPAAAPSSSNGRRLYESDCAPCHGESGAGDGPAAGGMDPPPTAFRGRYLERLSPRQVYSAVTFGIEDTAMPSYAGSYGQQQRWDVAFYTMTLRVGFQPTRPAEPVQMTLDELASSSNAELLARLARQNPNASLEEVDHLRAEGAPAPAPARSGAGASSGAGAGHATGYVLPINLVLNLYEALKVAHCTRSPWLGISVLELDRVAAVRDPAKPALPVHGVGIDDVFVPSPAAAAGVRTGDFLVELGGHAIQSVADFQKWLYVLGIGAEVELGLLRDGRPLRVTVTIEPRPAEASTS